MPFTVTARHSADPGTTAVTTAATDSTTPTASSLLIACMSAEDGAARTGDQNWQVLSGGGLTYSQRVQSPTSNFNNGASYRLSAAMFTANVGNAPAPFAITVDCRAIETTTDYYDVRVCDIVGHNTAAPIVQSAAGGSTLASASSGSGTVTLSTVPLAGNLLIVYFGVGADGAGTPASPTAGEGKTFTAISTNGTTWVAGGLWYRVCDGTESTTITCADLGELVGNYGATAIEIAADSESGPISDMTPVAWVI